MRILQIHTALNTGGIETFAASLANELSLQGHEVHVCSIFEPTKDAVCWNRLSKKVIRHTLGKRRCGFSIKEPIVVYHLIRQLRPDVVHVHGFIAYYLLSILLLHRSVRLVYTIHSEASKEGNAWDKCLYRIKKWLFVSQRVKAVTISHDSDKSFEAYYGTCSRTLIYNGITLPAILSEKRDEMLFIHAGRICEAKNQVMLCKVFDRLIKEGFPIHLLIAGDKQDETVFAQMQPYFSSQIEYIGCRSDIPQLMAKAGAMCLPSLWEGMPITLLEALATGCIPICTPVGGIKDVLIDSENGLMTINVDEEEYYQKVLQYIQMTDTQRAQIREHARQTAEQFSMEQTAKQYLNVYEDISNHTNL